MKWEKGLLMEIAGVEACTSRVVEIKEHLTF